MAKPKSTPALEALQRIADPETIRGLSADDAIKRLVAIALAALAE